MGGGSVTEEELGWLAQVPTKSSPVTSFVKADLTRLAQVLGAHAGQPTVLFMHHPPVPAIHSVRQRPTASWFATFL